MRLPHSNHPGYEAADCPERIKITAVRTGMSSNGYACSCTGGHCIPSESCNKIIKKENDELISFLGDTTYGV